MTITTVGSAACGWSCTERPSPRRDWRSSRGTAVTETIILTWIMLVFFAVAYQMFIVNETIYRSLTAVHSQLMNDGFKHNCYKADPDCWNDKDVDNPDDGDNAHVIWREHDGHNTLDIPEIRIIAVKMFQPFGLTKSVLIQSNVRGAEPAKGCNVPCKKTKMVAGAGGPSTHYTYQDGQRLTDFGALCCSNHTLYGRMFWALGKLNGDWFSAFQDRIGF